MNGMDRNDRVLAGVEAVEPDGMTELVRGNEAQLVERIAPLVRIQPVLLDLGRVERIDAAGVAALISLYRAAQEAGCRFGVINPRPHVAEILALLGLDRILMSASAEDEPPCGVELVASAA